MGKLTPEQQEAIFAHCDTAKLRESVQWIQAQFNITLSDVCLSRWLRKQRIHKSMDLRLEDIRDDRDRAMLIGNVVGAAAEITGANSVLFAQGVFEEFRKPASERDEDKLASYMTIALKARDQELKARTLELGIDRFRFDAAKKAREKAAELQKINEGAGDESEKVAKAVRLLFGEAPRAIGSMTPSDPSAEEPETAPEEAA